MGCISSIGKCIIILLNIFFLIIGIIFIAAGCILRFFPGNLLQFLLSGLESVDDQFAIGDGFGDLKDLPFLGEIGLALLLMGIILFSLAIIAFCGTCCKYRAMILLYVIILVILIIVISVVGALFIVRDSTLHQSIRDDLVEKVNKDYKGPQSVEGFTFAINILSYTLECCGMSGPDDFNTTENAAWKSYTHGGSTRDIHVTPACCRQDVLENDTDFECARKQGADYDPTLTNTKGCYDKLQDMLESVKTYAIVTLVVIIALLVMLAIFGILLFMDMGDNKVGQS